MDHTSSVPTLKLWSEGWTPKTLCCESQWGLHSRISLDYRKQAVLKGHRRTLYGYSLGLSAENSHLPVFTRKGLTAYPTSCCLRSNFQITLTYMLTAIFPGTWKTWWALPLPSPFGSFQQWIKSPVSPWKELVHTSGALTFMAVTQGTGPQITQFW